MLLLPPDVSASSDGYGQAARLLRPGLVDPKLSPPASETPPPRPIRTPEEVVEGLPIPASVRADVLAAIGSEGGGFRVASHLRRLLSDQPAGLVREVVSRTNRFAAFVRESTPRPRAPTVSFAAALGLRKGNVIKVGPHGGQIIGYAHGDQTKPIYAGKNPDLTHAHVYTPGKAGAAPSHVPVHDVHGPYAWTVDPAVTPTGAPAVVHLPTGRVIKTVQPKPGAAGPKSTASLAVKALSTAHGGLGLDAAPGGFTSKGDYQLMRAAVEAAESAPKAAPAPTTHALKLGSYSPESVAAWVAAVQPGAQIILTGPGGLHAQASHLTPGAWKFSSQQGVSPLPSASLTSGDIPALLAKAKAHGFTDAQMNATGGPKAKIVPPPAPPAPPKVVSSPASAPLDKAAAEAIVSGIAAKTGMTPQAIRAALTAPDAGSGNNAVAQSRARIEHAILTGGHARKHALLELLDGGHHTKAAVGARLDAIGSGDVAVLKKEYAATPVYDLQILTGAKASGKYNPNGAVCYGSRHVEMGLGQDGKYVTGNFRHELGHAVMMSWGYMTGGSAPAASPAGVILAHYKAAMAKMAAAPPPPPGGYDHEWYEINVGVIGARALDDAHEDAAEHYRGYHREALRHRFKGGGQLDTYHQRHPEMGALWDARYTAALLASAASKGVW